LTKTHNRVRVTHSIYTDLYDNHS